jgi:hypothetical protein
VNPNGPHGTGWEGSHINQIFRALRAIAATGLSEVVAEPPFQPP